jgi:hypothetical protein
MVSTAAAGQPVPERMLGQRAAGCRVAGGARPGGELSQHFAEFPLDAGRGGLDAG